jgi:hypothetical protein
VLLADTSYRIPDNLYEITDIPGQQQVLPGRDVDMEPYAEFTKLEQWDENGKPFLAEVGLLTEQGIMADEFSTRVQAN